MKLLLVGPYPPPHGGISVHVRMLQERTLRSGIECKVLNTDPRAAKSDQYLKIDGVCSFVRILSAHVRDGWAIHVHTNGHNPKSWLVAFVCGIAARLGAGGHLTLHSGLAPKYLSEGNVFIRALARAACRFYDRIICVNCDIRDAVAELGLPGDQLEIKEAYLPAIALKASLPPDLEAWARARSPLVSTTMFFRPEYGYDLLVSALLKLRQSHPNIGCIVMGGAENPPNIATMKDLLWLAGDTEHDLCIEIMSRSNVFVRPTYRDGDSVSVREAVGLGVPVVASNVGTRPDGVFLFNPGDVDGLVQQVQNVVKPRGEIAIS